MVRTPAIRITRTTAGRVGTAFACRWQNPFADGRTVLHFQGAGQSTSVWVGSTLAGTHKGGYDEFFVDITEAVQQLPAAEAKDGIPLAVMCDNSPDLERVPSDLSDFCLFGGLYRHVNLLYLPPVALELVHVLPVVGEDGSASVTVKARLYQPIGEQHALHRNSRGGRRVRPPDAPLDPDAGVLGGDGGVSQLSGGRSAALVA